MMHQMFSIGEGSGLQANSAPGLFYYEAMQGKQVNSAQREFIGNLDRIAVLRLITESASDSLNEPDNINSTSIVNSPQYSENTSY